MPNPDLVLRFSEKMVEAKERAEMAVTYVHLGDLPNASRCYRETAELIDIANVLKEQYVKEQGH